MTTENDKPSSRSGQHTRHAASPVSHVDQTAHEAARPSADHGKAGNKATHSQPKKKSHVKLVVIIVAIVVGVAAYMCIPSENVGNVTRATDPNSAIESANPWSRTVTFPSSFFAGVSDTDAVDTLRSLTTGGVTSNGDGSYTISILMSRYNRVVDTLHSSTASELDAMAGSDNFKDVASVSYDAQFANVTMTLTGDALADGDETEAQSIALAACLYQQIAGQPVSCTVSIVGAGGATLDTVTAP